MSTTTKHQAHFGHVTYEVEIGDVAQCVDGEGDVAFGLTINPTRKIYVRDTDPANGSHTPEYVRDTLVHELLHAAFAAAGFHPDDEEQVAGALAGQLSRFLADRRNADLLALLLPQQEPVFLEWKDPDPRTLANYADAVRRLAREVTEETGVETLGKPLCTAYSASSGLYCEHPADHLEDSSGFSHTFTRERSDLGGLAAREAAGG